MHTAYMAVIRKVLRLLNMHLKAEKRMLTCSKVVLDNINEMDIRSTLIMPIWKAIYNSRVNQT